MSDNFAEAFLNAIVSLQQPDQATTQARKWLTYVKAEYDRQRMTTPIDLLRAIAVLENDGLIDERVLRKIASADINQWGALSSQAIALGIANYEEALRCDNQGETYTGGVYLGRWEQRYWRCWPWDLIYIAPWDIRIRVATEAGMSAALAVAETRAGNHAKAAEILDDAHARGWTNDDTLFAQAYLHYTTKRWHDAITAGDKLRDTAINRDFDDQPLLDERGQTLPNPDLVVAGWIISGTGYAHLGNNGAAEEALRLATDPKVQSYKAELCAEGLRILALIRRQQSEESRAQELFGKALTLHPSDQIKSDQADPQAALVLTNAELIDRRTNRWDVTTEPSLAQEKAAKDLTERDEILSAALAKLDEFSGMEGVKAQVLTLADEIRVDEEMKRRGMEVAARTRHMVFSGPPGTGKTTIARIIGDILNGYGLTRTNSFVEAQRADFIGKYQGHTTDKTMGVLQSARGGVLFIDEAYSLINERGANSGGDDFGQEIVSQLLLALNEWRDDLVVIIAGYEKELTEFLATNSGLESRFVEWIRFESYSPRELAEITALEARERKTPLAEGAVDAVAEWVGEHLYGVIGPKGKPILDDLGNGRFARNLAERSSAKRATRMRGVDLATVSDEELKTITISDLRAAMDGVLQKYQLTGGSNGVAGEAMFGGN